MRKVILGGAAIPALLLGLPALAQDQATQGLGTVEIGMDDMLLSEVMGQRIYATGGDLPEQGATIDPAADGWDDIGQVNDVVLGQDGMAEAVIVGVGGFLGIGEKDVAIAMDQVRHLRDDGGETILAVATTAEALDSAPAFAMPEAETEAAAGGETATGSADVAQSDAADTASAGEEAVATTVAPEGESEAPVEGQAEAEVTRESEEATDAAQAEAIDGDARPAGTNTATAMGDNTEDEVTDQGRNLTAEVQETQGGTAADLSGEAGTATEQAATDQGMVQDGSADASAAGDYAEVDVDDLTSEELTGTPVFGSDGQELGEIDSLVLTSDGQVSEAIIDIGGFLGIGEKPVALSMDEVTITARSDDMSDLRIEVQATEEELRDMPRYEG